MDQEMIEKAYRLVDEIKATPEYRRFVEANERMLSDPKVNSLFERFRSCREAFDNMARYGRHHPDRTQRTKDYRQAKETLYAHPAVRDYITARRRLQAVLDDVASKIAQAVSERIPIEREILLTEEGGSPCATERASSSTSKVPGCSKGSRR